MKKMENFVDVDLTLKRLNAAQVVQSVNTKKNIGIVLNIGYAVNGARINNDDISTKIKNLNKSNQGINLNNIYKLITHYILQRFKL